jgi:hypothetical protein
MYFSLSDSSGEGIFSHQHKILHSLKKVLSILNIKRKRREKKRKKDILYSGGMEA